MVWQVQSQEENDNNDNNWNLQLGMVLRTWTCAYLIHTSIQRGKYMQNSCHSWCPQRLGEVLNVWEKMKPREQEPEYRLWQDGLTPSVLLRLRKSWKPHPTSLDHTQCYKMVVSPINLSSSCGKAAREGGTLPNHHRKFLWSIAEKNQDKTGLAG